MKRSHPTVVFCVVSAAGTPVVDCSPKAEFTHNMSQHMYHVKFVHLHELFVGDLTFSQRMKKKTLH
jgi:hypothetical protein